MSLVATEKNKESDAVQQLAGLNIGASIPASVARPPQPPRPSQPPPPPEPEEVEEDEDDPFADSNEVSTPAYERPEPRW